jgi:phage/plasmid-associated DNA primase
MKSGGAPEIANMHNKRTVLFSEPNDNQRLNLGTIKSLTGDGDINARDLYKSNTICRLPTTMLFECNKKPNIDGRIDDSAVRRFINIFFPSTFTSDEKLYEGVKGYYKANPEYKKESWQNRYKTALFNYLLKYDYTEIYEPESIREATRRYLLDNDDFSIFMEKYYERTEDEEDYVTIMELTSNYKNNYLKQGTKAYRQMSKKKFLELMKENLFWKHIYNQKYKERYRKNGKDILGVIIKLRKKDEIEEE